MHHSSSLLASDEEREDVEKKVGEALDENFTVLEEKKEKREELKNGGMHAFVCTNDWSEPGWMLNLFSKIQNHIARIAKYSIISPSKAGFDVLRYI